MSKLIMVDASPIKYQIWDTAGQEKYHSLAPMYYRGAAAAIIVYDITKASSFNTLKNWVRELQQLGPENIVIAVCGNKADLEDKRVRSGLRRARTVTCAPLTSRAHAPPPPRPQEVSNAEAKAYADEIGALFIETSAKVNKGVQDVFGDISRRLPQEAPANFGDVADLREKKGDRGEKKPGCC